MIRPPPRSTLFPHTTLFQSIHALSHEVSEWLNDPFVNNVVPAWSVPFEPQYGCSNYLETGDPLVGFSPDTDRKSTRLNSSHSQISYAVFCLKKKKKRRPLERYASVWGLSHLAPPDLCSRGATASDGGPVPARVCAGLSHDVWQQTAPSSVVT